MANFNLNKVILGGRLTADPELKQTPQGTSVTSFSLAVTRRTSKDKEAQTDFITCVAWRQTADFICRFFKKGSSICISGTIQVRTWNDNNGNKRYATEVVAEEAFFVDAKADGDANAVNNAPPVSFEEVNPDEDLPF